MHVSERRACAALGQHRSTQRKVPRGRDDEERLTADKPMTSRRQRLRQFRMSFPLALSGRVSTAAQ